ncbi:Panacea domain-containing protein [Sandaracinobacteroides saxicola]|uniref:DUF4065 domain-containing protein n=1 Tax=Sandaracinobacteroides saxicola TaxID=2759707 RepID=A0A7G5IF64_9SPHN|nr:type II toxin-antitoxin system antitoxin SocA domain-containing protein [Sandaracinobacteroides saxicola]QMW22006.1 DUF4065 domain-containing protein [Sandaracinobacteroides saxicola]
MFQQDQGYDVRELANFILDYGRSRKAFLTNMALNKVLYFLVESCLVTSGRIITQAKIEAWEHGPVFPEIYRNFKVHGDKPIDTYAKRFDVISRQMVIAKPSIAENDARQFSAIIEPLISLSAARLRSLSHLPGSAWDMVWNHDGPVNPGMEITPQIIIDASMKGVNA